MFTYLGDLNLRRGQNVWVYYPFLFTTNLVLANKFSIETMGPTRYLILQQIPISSLLDPNPVIETTENLESNKEIIYCLAMFVMKSTSFQFKRR